MSSASGWIHGKRSKRRKPFFAPGKVLSRVFRGKFIASLKRAFTSGKLAFHGRLKSLGDEAAFEQLLNKAVRHDWIVYAKRPFSSPDCGRQSLVITDVVSPTRPLPLRRPYFLTGRTINSNCFDTS